MKQSNCTKADCPRHRCLWAGMSGSEGTVEGCVTPKAAVQQAVQTAHPLCTVHCCELSTTTPQNSFVTPPKQPHCLGISQHQQKGPWGGSYPCLCAETSQRPPCFVQVRWRWQRTVSPDVSLAVRAALFPSLCLNAISSTFHKSYDTGSNSPEHRSGVVPLLAW